MIYTFNGGAAWARAAFTVAGRARAPAPTSIFADEAGVLYVGTQDGGAYVCTDTVHLCDGSGGSGKWTPWGLNAASGPDASPRMITAIAESNPPSAPRTFWMATSQGLYRKLPGASAWTKAIGNPGYVYNEVAVDPSCRSRIYTGVGYLDPISRSRRRPGRPGPRYGQHLWPWLVGIQLGAGAASVRTLADALSARPLLPSGHASLTCAPSDRPC